MAIEKERKSELISKFGKNKKDTGRIEVQVAILTDEILQLTEHLKKFKKDYHSKSGLYGKVSKRNSLLSYLKREDLDRYNKVIKELKIRN